MRFRFALARISILAELIPAHGGILVFLESLPETVELGIYCSA